MIGWPVSWLDGRLVHWSVSRFVGRSVGWKLASERKQLFLTGTAQQMPLTFQMRTELNPVSERMFFEEQTTDKIQQPSNPTKMLRLKNEFH
jgi:hypothetical protein